MSRSSTLRSGLRPLFDRTRAPQASHFNGRRRRTNFSDVQ
ncbi:hypothetical protein HMPREF3036_02403 [Sutterella sp. KLE1602]|nr:hypothetical protein HMPREF3036_02403 [Sutterella sp. KLE1602]